MCLLTTRHKGRSVAPRYIGEEESLRHVSFFARLIVVYVWFLLFVVIGGNRRAR